MNRLRKVSAALAVVVIAGGFMALGSAAQAAPVVQDGPVNYAGPGPCPAGTTDCLVTSGDIDIIQKAPSTGKNTVDCRGGSCTAVQKGLATTDKPTNVADCKNATTAAASDQRCNLTQTGSSNTINADLSASPTTGGVVNFANVTQVSKQRFTTVQTGDTNTLNVKGTISQTANSAVDASTPVTHNQQTLIASNNTMTAAVRNVADYNLNRTQTSSATGATPTSLQDTTAGAESDGAKLGLGAVRLVAKSAGTNQIKVRGNDTKNQQATSLNLGQATQQQGHAAGGWIADFSGTDSAVANAGGVPDIDVGSVSTDGLVKDWTQHAQGLLGGAIAKDQDQIDDIRVPLLGKSPFVATIGGRNKLRTDEGGHEVCNASSEGHAKTNASGKLSCDMLAGTKAKNPSVTWSGTTWKVNVNCEVNTDNCPGGTVTTLVKSVDIKVYGEDKQSGVIPVAILSKPNDNNDGTVDDASTIDPATVCFGEPDSDLAAERDCTIANKATLVDADGDSDIDLKMQFESAQTGIDKADATACLTAKTYSGDKVEGCGPLPKG
jgi:hypothetical protein